MSKTKKKGIRSLAILLALILTLGFSPVTNAEAKSAPRLNYKKVTLVQGKKKKLKVKGTKRRVKWYSTKKSVATVNKKGVVKAKKKGKATIVAKVGKKKYRCKVTVKKKTFKKKTNGKRVKLNKSVKKQLPCPDFLAFEKPDGIAVGTSVDFFSYLMYYGKDMTGTTDSVRANYFKWYSSDRTVLSFDKRGIATGKKVGLSKVYCKYVNTKGKWEKSREVTVKVMDGGNVKFSYTLGMEESPFSYKNLNVWDYYKHNTFDESLPKFNTLTVRIQNNSSKSVRIDNVSASTSSTPKWIYFEKNDQKSLTVAANSTETVKFYSCYAYTNLGAEVCSNYIIDSEVFSMIKFDYAFGGKRFSSEVNKGSTNWKSYKSDYMTRKECNEDNPYK